MNLFVPASSLPNPPTTIPTDGFVKYGESNYSLMKLKLEWHEAEKYCKLHSSLIASILDPYSNAFAWMQMQKFNEPVWIALNSNLVRCWEHVGTWCDWLIVIKYDSLSVHSVGYLLHARHCRAMWKMWTWTRPNLARTPVPSRIWQAGDLCQKSNKDLYSLY